MDSSGWAQAQDVQSQAGSGNCGVEEMKSYGNAEGGGAKKQ